MPPRLDTCPSGKPTLSLPARPGQAVARATVRLRLNTGQEPAVCRRAGAQWPESEPSPRKALWRLRIAGNRFLRCEPCVGTNPDRGFQLGEDVSCTCDAPIPPNDPATRPAGAFACNLDGPPP